MARPGGRPPIPSALKLVKGTERKGRVNRDEPKPPPGEPECPEWLTERGRQFFEQEAARLREMGLFNSCDQATFWAYCRAYERWMEAAEAIRDNGGSFVEGTNKNGSTYLMTHPAVAIEKDSSREMTRLAALFGLNPSDRQRVSAPVQPKKSPLEELRDAKAARAKKKTG
jgi:P27 family predicted phage terminase small subunit